MVVSTSCPPPSATILEKPALASAARISTTWRYRSSWDHVSIIIRFLASASSRARSARTARSSNSKMTRFADSEGFLDVLGELSGGLERDWKAVRSRSAFSARFRVEARSRRRASVSRHDSERREASCELDA